MKKPDIKVNNRVLVPLVIVFIILTLLFPRTAKFGYDYRKGSPWAYETLIAQFDFPILKTDEQLREERSKNKTSLVPYYRYRQEVVDNSRKAADKPAEDKPQDIPDQTHITTLPSEGLSAGFPGRTQDIIQSTAGGRKGRTVHRLRQRAAFDGPLFLISQICAILSP